MTILLASLRTFQFVTHNNKLFVMWSVLHRSRVDLIGILITFIVLILGFMLSGYVVFGVSVDGFSSVSQSFSTCWNFVIGNAPDYSELQQVNRSFGPLFFVLFSAFIFFVLLNMFIAILSDGFEGIGNRDDDIFTGLVTIAGDFWTSLTGKSDRNKAIKKDEQKVLEKFSTFRKDVIDKLTQINELQQELEKNIEDWEKREKVKLE